MKKLLTLFLVLFCWSAVAQTPQRERINRLDTITSLKVPTTTDCTTGNTNSYAKVGDLCFDTDSDPDGDGVIGAFYQCLSASSTACTSWSLVGSGSSLSAIVTTPSNTADIDGNGTAASADWNGDGTTSNDEKGSSVTGALLLQKLYLQNAMGKSDLDANGTFFSYGTVNAGNILSAYAHASLYGDPESYLRPAVFNAYSEVFKGRPLYADCDNSGGAGGPSGAECGTNGEVTPLISQCGTNACTTDTTTVCITTTDATANGAADTNNDGTVDFAVGDVITFTASVNTSTGGKSYWISAIANGTGAGVDCPVSTDNFLTVREAVDQNTVSGPDTDANGAVDANMAIVRIWANDTHYSRNGAHFLGYRLGYAPRSRDGVQGPNLLRNGEADSDTPPENWVTSGGSFGGNSFAVTPNTGAPGFTCAEGGTNACLFMTGSAAAYTETLDMISVVPGETYILSGYILFPDANDQIALVDDRDRNGIFTADSALSKTFTAAERANNFSAMYEPLWLSFEIPEGVHQVRVRITKGGGNTIAWDSLALRKATNFKSDSWVENEKAGVNFLINDPGDRCINLTGDSWATAGTSYSNVRIGLADAMAARYPHKTSAQWQSQIFLNGAGGYKASDVLTNWYNLVEKPNCLYTVFFVSTNDIVAGTATATWVAQMREIGQRAMMFGTIPIFISPPPLGPAGNAIMTTARTLKDAEMRAFLNFQPGGGAVAPTAARTVDSTGSGVSEISVASSTINLDPDKDATFEATVTSAGAFTTDQYVQVGSATNSGNAYCIQRGTVASTEAVWLDLDCDGAVDTDGTDKCLLTGGATGTSTSGYELDADCDGTPNRNLLSVVYEEKNILAAQNTSMGANTYDAATPANNQTYWHVPAAGRLYSLECWTNAAITAGTATFTVRVNNGSNSDLSVVLNSTGGSGGAADDSQTDTTCTSNCTFIATDKIQMRIVTDAGYLPVTADQTCRLVIELKEY